MQINVIIRVSVNYIFKDEIMIDNYIIGIRLTICSKLIYANVWKLDYSVIIQNVKSSNCSVIRSDNLHKILV